MRFNKSVLISVLAVGFASAAHSAAISFSFDPTGTGSAGVVGTVLDLAPGNSLAQNATVPGGASLPVGSQVVSLFQANLNSVLNGSPVYSQGQGGNFFTFVAGFTETVTSSTLSNGIGSSSFQVQAGGFFKMCAKGAAGNDLAGTGFSCAGQGILSGRITGGTGGQFSFPLPLANLDNFGANNYAGVQTVQSSGAGTLNLQIEYANSQYFTNLLSGDSFVFAFTNTSNVTPFNQVDPSAFFSSNGIANGNVASNIGAINGISGPNFQFQADANASFDRLVVPEPGSLALVGLALAVGGVAIRRRRV